MHKTTTKYSLSMLVALSIAGVWITAYGQASESNMAVPADSITAEPGQATRDGLAETIAGYLRVKDVRVPGEQTIKMRVEGFADELAVQAVIQDHPAPLVVVILGLSAKTKSDYSKQWPAWLAEAGFHVLYFDSTFGDSFQKVARRGVSGNVFSEAESARDVIAAFTNRSEIQGRITRIGLVGYSYGAVEALILGKMSAEGKLPFELSAIQAYEPPLDLRATANVLDRWFEEDRPRYTLIELQRMFKISSGDEERELAKLSPSAMRAAIAATFREELSNVIVENDKIYKLGLLPKTDAVDEEYVRKDAADQYGFIPYAEGIALPFWAQRMGYANAERMVNEATVFALLPAQPNFCEVIEAANDPFNTPDQLELLQRQNAGQRLTIIPHGGHLGYMSDSWTRSKLISLFGQPDALKSSATGIERVFARK